MRSPISRPARFDLGRFFWLWVSDVSFGNFYKYLKITITVSCLRKLLTFSKLHFYSAMFFISNIWSTPRMVNLEEEGLRGGGNNQKQEELAIHCSEVEEGGVIHRSVFNSFFDKIVECFGLIYHRWRWEWERGKVLAAGWEWMLNTPVLKLSGKLFFF